jgi:hypothetical protein
LEDYIKSKTQINNIDINDYDDADKHEYDSLEALRLKILNGEKIDDRDPKVYEGKLIDKTSREYIKMKYIRLNVYDFDELYKDIHNLKYLANETKKYLEKDNFILFQPVFIFKDKAITRPDVFIKEKGKYTLIEVKATSKPKSKHLVDMIYQHNIISHVLSERDDFIDDYLLCVIKYAKGEKGKVNFDLTEHIPLVKAGKELGKKDSARFPEQLKYSDEAIEARRLARLDNDSEVTIKNLMQGHVSALENRNKGVYETHVAKLLDTKYFEKIIDELQA